MTELNGIKIKTTFHSLDLWTGTPIADTYGNKTVLNSNGRPAFAELVALDYFLAQNYKGVWVDTYRKKFRIGLPETTEPVDLPPGIKEQFEKIINENGGLKGTWDLLLWKEQKLKFVELKRKGKDAIRQTQIDFLIAAIRAGHEPDDFEIYEWDVTKKN